MNFIHALSLTADSAAAAPKFGIFEILALIGGISLFLFGMNVMGDGLERRAGNGLKALLGKLTNSKIKGFLTGLAVTAIIQSSAATTVMAVGFVNSGIMTLKQSIGVIMGANIGTTVTAWILSLSGISGDNIFIQMLKPTSFTPILALIGTIFMMFCKSDKKKDTGTILLGFATLMFGMTAMTDAVQGLADIPEVQQMFVMFSNPILGVIVGALLTALIQSSSASVGVLQALSSAGLVTYGTAIPIIMGQNIGTCVTALLSSFGTNKNAKRVAVVHLSFNVIGTVVWLVVFSLVNWLVHPIIFDSLANPAGIAIAHSLFNILCTAFLLPCSFILEKIAYLVVPESKKEKDEKNTVLDDRLLATPAIALEQASNLTNKMAQTAIDGFLLSMSLFDGFDQEVADEVRRLEEDSDRLEDTLGTYLARLSRSQVSEKDSLTVSKLLKAIGDFERISDHSINIVESAEELRAKNIELTGSAKKELKVLCSAVAEILELSKKSFIDNDINAAYNVEPLEEVIDNLKKLLRDSHIQRLKSGDCTVEAGFVWSDMITNLERVSDHCSNIAVCVIDAHDNTMNVHASLKTIKKNNSQYEKKVLEFYEKYIIEE